MENDPDLDRVPDPADALAALRQEIDAIDDEILRALGRRADFARQVGFLKQTSGWSFHVPERERSVIERVKNQADAFGFPAAAVASVYREIMSACLRLESPIIVSYLGPGSTHSYYALRKVFGDSAQVMPERTLGQVFDALEGDRTDYAIVPIENSFEGTVHESMQRLIRTKVYVHGEYFHAIEHALLTRSTRHSEITRIMSHPQAFLQCRDWLSQHLPQAEQVATTSTAQACFEVANQPTWAAIASEGAAAETGLSVLARNIQDRGNNETRFLILSREKKLKTRSTDKTSIIFSVPNLSGKLSHVLEAFGGREVNIHKLESVPDRSRPWKAHFWMDLDGLVDDGERDQIFSVMQKHCDGFHHIGTYSRLE
jgi:chorismate mutase/prephenate dehydratase